MKKIAVIFDSSCGSTEQHIKKLGGYFLPIVVECDGNEYKAGVDITGDELEKKLTLKSKCKTASVPMGVMSEKFDELLKKGYEKIIYFPISKGLSSTYDTATNVASSPEYKGKVYVYPESEIIDWWFVEMIEPIMNMAKENKTIESIFEFVDYGKQYRKAAFCPGDIEFLKSGGRINKMQYFAASLFGITPIILAWDGRIDKGVDKARKIDKAVAKACDHVYNWYKEAEEAKINATINIVAGQNKEVVEKIKATLKELGYTKKIILVGLPPEIVAHVGPGYWGLGVSTIKK